MTCIFLFSICQGKGEYEYVSLVGRGVGNAENEWVNVNTRNHCEGKQSKKLTKMLKKK
jgi:hypothetical protein